LAGRVLKLKEEFPGAKGPGKGPKKGQGNFWGGLATLKKNTQNF